MGRNIAKVYADLKIQSMMFDMDVDWETLELEPKRTNNEPAWITNWKNKRDDADNDASAPEQAGW